MSELIDRAAKLTRRAKRIERALKFWLALSQVTRFGIHGFVLAMIRRTISQAQENNKKAIMCNKEMRRVRRIRRGERQYHKGV